MYQKILVPIDDSAAAFRALDEACTLGRTLNITVRVVHVVDLAKVSLAGVTAADNLSLRQSVHAASSAMLAHAEEMVAQRGVAFEGNIVENTVGNKIADIVLHEAQQHACQLIIMGTHGLSGVKRLLLGSVAEGVIRQANIPVMLIRATDDAV